MDKLPQTIKFKVESFKKIPNPYIFEKEIPTLTAPAMYIAIANVNEIPDNFPMTTNPREQNLNTKVSKKIKESLLGPENDFYLLNRGLLLSANSTSFSPYSKELSIVFTDLSTHGNVDGGHTYKTILENRDLLDPKSNQFIKIEILTGVEDFFQDLAEARNTSTQVKTTSLGDLKNKFSLLKKSFEHEPFKDNISYHENQDGDIPITEILAILNMFNIDRYPISNEKSFPIISYSANKKCLDNYFESYDASIGNPNIINPYKKMLPIITDILKLYDKLETNIGKYYKESTPNGKYGLVKGVVVINQKAKNKKKSKFYAYNLDYLTAKGLIYPVLGAFRALIFEKDNQYKWFCDPFKMMDIIGPSLVNSVIDRSRTSGNNPNAVGKDAQQWKTLFQTVLIKKLTSFPIN